VPSAEVFACSCPPQEARVARRVITSAAATVRGRPTLECYEIVTTRSVRHDGPTVAVVSNSFAASPPESFAKERYAGDPAGYPRLYE
jgi:hypothetical protein